MSATPRGDKAVPGKSISTLLKVATRTLNSLETKGYLVGYILTQQGADYVNQQLEKGRVNGKQ